VTNVVVIMREGNRLGGQDAGTTDSADGGLGVLGEELGLDDDRLVGELTGTEDLEETLLGHVDDGGLGGVLGVLKSVVLGDEGPDLVDVEGLAVEAILQLVEVSHTDLTEITRMVLVHVNSVMMLTTGKTATARMLAVLADTTVTTGNVTALLAVLAETSRHFV